jgi:signal transduction histidine kinase
MANLTVPTTQPKPKAKVMVVDDENGPRQSLRMLLKDDFDVRLACDVPSALLLLEEEEVHVVVSDIRMPLQTGVDLLQQVKEKNPETQVILLTGYPHLESAMQAVEFGAFAYLEKPFDNNVMMQRVQDAVNRYNAEHEHRVLEKLAIEANRFETLGRLVSGMIHDMGTPLSVVGSQIEIIMGNPNRPDLADRLGTMQSQVRHCSEMVRSAMNFLRYDTQPVTPFYINNLVETCLEVGRPILRSQNVKIERVLATDMPASIGDLVLVRQAVLNLIVNACHAMDKQENPRELTIETWSDNDYIYLAVEDSGPGIPPEVRQRVFETFFTTKGKKGTGLGLAVVKNVMNRHKGQVTLESGPGKGARFILQFPTASREEIVNLFTKKESS